MADAQPTTNIFYRELIYPDPQGLISWLPNDLNEVKEKACVVLDTNALLVPYATGKASLEEIAKKYEVLVSEKRLIIPGQVIREFAMNRVSKLQELHQQLTRKKNVTVGRAIYPLLEGVHEYRGMIELEDEIDRLIRSYKVAVDKVLDHVRTWYWNDPVTNLYRRLFIEGVVQDPTFDKEELKQDLAVRVLHSIPPGYKDARKEDGGLGDLLIWRTILEIGKTRKLPLIFVSDDQKADWWHQSEGLPLYPRFELVDEYRRHSGGQSFHMMTFSAFLEIVGASKTLVEEVRKEEEEVRAKVGVPLDGDHVGSGAAIGAASSWLQNHYGAKLSLSKSGLFDYVVTSEDRTEVGFRLKYVASNPPAEYLKSSIEKFRKRLADVMRHRPAVTELVVLLIVDRPIAAAAVAEKIKNFPVPGIRILVGFVDATGAFQLVSNEAPT